LKKGKIAFFVTGNADKYQEARIILSEPGISAAMLHLEISEIQADDIDRIAEASALEGAKKSKMPIFVEDAGLFIEALNGFPGPYSSYVYRTLGNQGILKLLKDVAKRNAYFFSVVAFCDSGKPYSLRCFNGKVNGRIALKERGRQGFGFDPIFEPSTKPTLTFAQMTPREKNKYSHRAKALRKFAAWYIQKHAKLNL